MGKLSPEKLNVSISQSISLSQSLFLSLPLTQAHTELNLPDIPHMREYSSQAINIVSI